MSRNGVRLAGLVCLMAGAGMWWSTDASAGTNLGPSQTAWYDNTGAQQYTGETTPSAAGTGELEVSYTPAAATVPTQTVPSAPSVPGAPVAPPSGNAGGNTVGNTLAFAAVEYAVPLTSGGHSLDPSSITALLTLTLDTTSSQGVQAGDLIACPTDTTLWSAGGDQDASAAPPYSCSGDSVAGDYDSSNNSVSFSLTSAQESSLMPGTFSLVIIPGSSTSGPFQAVFNPPGDASLSVTAENALSNPNLNLANPTPSQAVTPAEVGNVSPLAFALGPQSTTTTAPTTDQKGSPSALPISTAAPASLRGGIGSGAQRTVALIVLLGLGALLVTASSRRTREPHSLLRHAEPGAASPPS